MLVQADDRSRRRTHFRLSGRRGPADLTTDLQQDKLHTFSLRALAGANPLGRGRRAPRPARCGCVLGDLGPLRHQCGDRPTDALIDSIPLSASSITGQVPTHRLGRRPFSRCDTVGITRGRSTKPKYLVKNVNYLARLLHEAFHIASSGRRYRRGRHPVRRAVTRPAPTSARALQMKKLTSRR